METASPLSGEALALVERAAALAAAGRLHEAEQICRRVIGMAPRAIEPRSLFATLAVQSDRFDEAAEALTKCSQLAPLDAQLAFRQGWACERAGRSKEAIEAYLRAFRLEPHDPRLALFAGAALEDAGRYEEAAIVFSFGDDADSQMRKLHLNPDAPREIKERSKKADFRVRERFTQLHAEAVDEVERRLSREARVPNLERVRRAVWPQTHASGFQYRTPLQAPDIFYMADLPASPTLSRENLPWARAVEACVDVIRREYQSAIEHGAPMAPYVHANTQAPTWRELKGKMDWSSLHLYAHAEATPAVQLFPETLRALEAADVVRVKGGTPIELFFSRLAPGAHIPPHCGAANNRLTVHLPLVVPADCGIRIGHETHSWRAGEILAFDDSFEHEAWNNSGSERVVLIFEAHHPDLSLEERRAIEFVFEARDRWRQSRRVPER